MSQICCGTFRLTSVSAVNGKCMKGNIQYIVGVQSGRLFAAVMHLLNDLRVSFFIHRSSHILFFPFSQTPLAHVSTGTMVEQK